MIIDTVITIELSKLGIDSDNYHILKEVATRSSWETAGYSKVHFFAEHTSDFADIEKDIKSIALVTAFERENNREAI